MQIENHEGLGVVSLDRMEIEATILEEVEGYDEEKLEGELAGSEAYKN